MGGSNAALALTGEVTSIFGCDNMSERRGSWGGGAGAWAWAEGAEKFQTPNPKLQINTKFQAPIKGLEA
jgi:hypothetical protein